MAIRISDLTLGHWHGLQLKVSGLLAPWLFGEPNSFIGAKTHLVSGSWKHGAAEFKPPVCFPGSVKAYFSHAGVKHSGARPDYSSVPLVT